MSEARLRGDTLSLRLHATSALDPNALIDLVGQSQGAWALSPPDMLRHKLEELPTPIDELATALTRLEALPRRTSQSTPGDSA